MSLSVTFWGAAGSVTGSMHLVEAAGRKVLLDCGLVRGVHAYHRGPESDFPFSPADLDAVVLSHAHMDHCGNLPRLIREGFSGPIYCTPSTRDLASLMLQHAARAQDEQARVRCILDPASSAPTHGLETSGDGHTGRSAARSCERETAELMTRFIPVPYSRPTEILPGVQLQLENAGHILGSATATLALAATSRDLTLTFTGDLGRLRPPLLRPPTPLPATDLLLTESTYGGRCVEAPEQAAQALEDIVKRTADRGGKVLIPAFSLGRTQTALFVLLEAFRAGRLPPLPVFVDSPLAAAIAEAHRRHPADLDPEAAHRLQSGIDPLSAANVHYLRTSDDSHALEARAAPCILIAPSGMCEGGRIVHHLKHHIDDPRCTVALITFQAAHTLGRRLLERGPTVRIHGRKWNKWADIVYLPGFSGHADHEELLALLGPLAGRTRKVRLVHGEPEEAAAVRSALLERGFPDVHAPTRGESVCLSA